MKKRILLVIISVLICLFSQAQIPTYVPTNSLVGWWPFNGNANDNSANGNNGTVMGATLTTDRFNNSNAAYLFNGNSDQIQVPDANSLDLNNKYTLSAWYNTNSNTPVLQAPLGKARINGQTGYQLLANIQSNILQFGFNDGNLNGAVTTPITIGNIAGWHLLTGTYDGTTAKIYIDGQLMNSGIVSYTLQNSTYPLLFGTETAILNRYFNGKLDDIGIWSRALTDCEVKRLYYGASFSISANSATICAGQNYTLSASGALNYSWSTGAMTPTAVVSPSVSNVFTVTSTYTTGCTDSKTISVSVLPSPTISVNSGSICMGESFTIAPSGANSYSFQGGSAIKTPTATTTYSVIGTNSAGCLSQTAAFCTITVNQNPSISVNSGTICNGQSFTITPSGANTYSYQNGNSVVSPTASSSFSVLGASAEGCLSAAVASTITVLQNPSITVNNASICAGNSVNLIATGATTYTWSTNANTSTIIVNPSTTTIYTVSGTSNNCAKTQTTQVKVSACTGIDEFETVENLSILPNPNNGEFWINSNTNIKLNVTDLLGRTITQIEIQKGSNHFRYENLARGIYFFMGEGNGRIYSGKMMVL